MILCIFRGSLLLSATYLRIEVDIGERMEIVFGSATGAAGLYARDLRPGH